MRRLLGCVALVTAFGVLHAIPMAQDPKDPGIGDPQVGGVCTAARIQGFASDERKATWQLADNCKYFVTLFTQTIHYGFFDLEADTMACCAKIKCHGNGYCREESKEGYWSGQDGTFFQNTGNTRYCPGTGISCWVPIHIQKFTTSTEAINPGADAAGSATVELTPNPSLPGAGVQLEGADLAQGDGAPQADRTGEESVVAQGPPVPQSIGDDSSTAKHPISQNAGGDDSISNAFIPQSDGNGVFFMALVPQDTGYDDQSMQLDI